MLLVLAMTRDARRRKRRTHHEEHEEHEEWKPMSWQTDWLCKPFVLFVSFVVRDRLKKEREGNGAQLFSGGVG
jgi:hypothetical protein